MSPRDRARRRVVQHIRRLRSRSLSNFLAEPARNGNRPHPAQPQHAARRKVPEIVSGHRPHHVCVGAYEKVTLSLEGGERIARHRDQSGLA